MSAYTDLLISFYGDDFTGTTDVMESLAKAGLRTVSFITPPTREQIANYKGLQAFGVAGVSRSLKTSELQEELQPVFESFRAIGPRIAHYKTCSTFDSSPEIGSIGKALDIGADLFGTKTVPMVVGAPILGRHLVFGNLFARSGLDSEPFRLDRHPTMMRHPITPMQESDVRLHLQKQTARRMELLDILKINLPADQRDKALAALMEKKPQILIFDTLYDQQQAVVGECIWKMAHAGHTLFTVGSSGLEYALTAHWKKAGMIQSSYTPVDPGTVDPLLVLSGSCSPVTQGQIEWAMQNGFAEVPLNTECFIDERRNRECERATTLALENLERGQSVILHTAKGPDDQRIRQVTEQLKQKNFSDLDIKLKSGRYFGEALGEIFLRVAERKKLKRVATTGGDTSGYFARTAGIEALEMVGPLAPGSPLCHLHKKGSHLDGMQITFKGGQVGKKDFFAVVRRGLPS